MKISRPIILFCIAVSLSFMGYPQTESSAVFIVSPYLQVGYHPSTQSLELVWQAGTNKSIWAVEERTGSEKLWTQMMAPQLTAITVSNLPPHTVYKTLLTPLRPGSNFEYRVLKDGQVVFSSDGKAPKSAGQPYRFVVFGDIGAGTKEAKEMAHQAFLAMPDLVVVPGDIVYEYGLVSEYRTRFWPIYNADKADSNGAPLMRSVPFIAAPGNHDADTRDLDRYPDALAYYTLWDLPLNGPVAKEGSALVPVLKASDAARKAFTTAAGDAYPRMANFSYNYGNAHWTVLDADTYVDWTDSTLQKWVADDLASVKEAAWKFVVFHHPGFNSSREHFEQQQMRVLSPLFEKGGVDVVFNGHVHNYQRSYPMHFVPDNSGVAFAPSKNGKPRGRLVNGRWTLDKKFNGKNLTKPDGVIYIVTGAGGQELYNPEQTNDPDSWQKFTCRFVSSIHSLTVADVAGKKLTIRQVGEDGKELDRFTITK